jgi:hypothetical protein
MGNTRPSPASFCPPWRLAVLDELARIAPIHGVRGNIDNEHNNLGEKMMPLKEFYRYELVGNKFECWDCKGKNDMVRCTCWFADEGDREVILPPGRLRLPTKPIETGSLPTSKTIGIFLVAAWAATAPGVGPVTITATERLTRSAANAGNLSY